VNASLPLSIKTNTLSAIRERSW